jgi:hypothetical protein
LLGALPKVGGGIGGRFGIIVAERLRVDVGGAYWPGEPATLPSRPTAGGTIRLAAADASACYALFRSIVELSPCLGIEVGSMGGTGFGIRTGESGASPWVAPHLGGAVTVPASRRVAAWLGVDALAPVLRPPFVLTGAGTAFTAARVVGRASLGLEARF